LADLPYIEGFTVEKVRRTPLNLVFYLGPDYPGFIEYRLETKYAGKSRPLDLLQSIIFFV